MRQIIHLVLHSEIPSFFTVGMRYYLLIIMDNEIILARSFGGRGEQDGEVVRFSVQGYSSFFEFPFW
ncbi:MAG: hypothetical protein ACREYC_11945, partial [Gammaproteobacteria bacterium]